MAASGLIPHDEHYLTPQEQAVFAAALRSSVRVPKERLAEFDRLMAEGIEAVVKALEKKKPSEEGSHLA